MGANIQGHNFTCSSNKMHNTIALWSVQPHNNYTYPQNALTKRTVCRNIWKILHHFDNCAEGLGEQQVKTPYQHVLLWYSNCFLHKALKSIEAELKLHHISQRSSLQSNYRWMGQAEGKHNVDSTPR